MILKTITITHLGAKTCVTGSCHLIQFQPDHGGGINILVDCGIAQGHDPQVSFGRFPVPLADIDYLFLTHAHIDHIGRVPDLIDAGFCGEIICTHGTKALLLPMLRDAMSFSDRTDPQIRAMEKQIDDLSWGFELYDTFTLTHGITFTLKNVLDHPIRFNHLYAVEKFQNHQRLLHLNGPAVTIAKSGMCTGGRIVNHLKHGLDDPKNDLFFVGCQTAPRSVIW